VKPDKEQARLIFGHDRHGITRHWIGPEIKIGMEFRFLLIFLGKPSGYQQRRSEAAKARILDVMTKSPETSYAKSLDFPNLGAIPKASLDLDGFGREDVLNLLKAFEVRRHPTALSTRSKRQRTTTFLITAKLHAGDVHIRLPQNGSDIADDARLIVVC
jgi:hypothetical protein